MGQTLLSVMFDYQVFFFALTTFRHLVHFYYWWQTCLRSAKTCKELSNSAFIVGPHEEVDMGKQHRLFPLYTFNEHCFHFSIRWETLVNRLNVVLVSLRFPHVFEDVSGTGPRLTGFCNYPTHARLGYTLCDCFNISESLHVQTTPGWLIDNPQNVSSH